MATPIPIPVPNPFRIPNPVHNSNSRYRQTVETGATQHEAKDVTSSSALGNITPKLANNLVEEQNKNLSETGEEEEVLSQDGQGLKFVRAPCQKDENDAPEGRFTIPSNQPFDPSLEAVPHWTGD